MIGRILSRDKAHNPGWHRVRPGFLVALVGAVVAWWLTSDPAPPAPPTVVAAPEAEILPAIVDTLESGETFSELWQDHELDSADLQALVEAGSNTPDFSWRRLRPGSQVLISLTSEGALGGIDVEFGRDQRLVADRRGEEFRARVVETPFVRERRQASTCIESSFWEALSAAGEDPSLVLTLAQILGGQVDFYSDLRAGDCVAIAFTVDVRPDESYRLASIDAVVLELADQTYEAYRFSSDGEKFGYYDADGQTLKRRFLRSPLRFTRISSRFGMRMHPVLRRRRQHNGVDYAAPTGTPVQASGDGVVVRAGRFGGYGLYVRLQHGRRYMTAYGHLSRIASGITPGARVQQGDIIGFVGSTGLSTGPHLDYSFMRDGKYVDPLSVSLPVADPLEGQARAAFIALRDIHRLRLPALGMLAIEQPTEVSDGQ